MNTEELGIWLLLGQSWSALGVLDLGFGAVLARQIALVRGQNSQVGANRIEASPGDIGDLFVSGSRVAKVLAFLTFTLSLFLGYLYLSSLALESTTFFSAMLAWTIICVGQAITVWNTSWSCLLIGLGHGGWEILLTSSVSLLAVAGQIISALAGGGVIALAAIQTLAAVLSRALFRQVMRRYQPEVLEAKGRWRASLMKPLISPALRSWLTALGGVMILQTDQFFVAKLQSAEALPAYRAAYLLCLNVQMLSVTVASATAPFLSQIWQTGRLSEVKSMVSRTMRLGLCLTLTGLALVGIGGPDIFTLWLGPGHFVGYALLNTFIVMMFFEAHSFMASTLSRATADEAFAFWSLGAGLLKLALCFGFASQYGLIGIAASTVIAQAATLYWYTIVRALRRLAIPWSEYARDVLRPLGLTAAGVLTAGFMARMVFSMASYQYRLLAITVAIAIPALGSVIVVASDRQQRHRLWLGLRRVLVNQ